MDISSLFARDVAEEHIVTQTIDQAIAQYPRLEDVFEGLKWRLARAPAFGVPIPGNPEGYYVIKTEEWDISGVPVLTAIYKFDDEQVTIVSLKIGS